MSSQSTKRLNPGSRRRSQGNGKPRPAWKRWTSGGLAWPPENGGRILGLCAVCARTLDATILVTGALSLGAWAGLLHVGQVVTFGPPGVVEGRR